MRRDRVASLHARRRPDTLRAGGGLDPWVVSTAAARLRAAFTGRVLRRAVCAAWGGVTRPLHRRERTPVRREHVPQHRNRFGAAA